MSKLEELSKAEPAGRLLKPDGPKGGVVVFTQDPRPLVALLIQARDALKLLDHGTRFSEATETLAALAAFEKGD